jgi:hypothetical protein
LIFLLPSLLFKNDRKSGKNKKIASMNYIDGGIRGFYFIGAVLFLIGAIFYYRDLDRAGVITYMICAVCFVCGSFLDIVKLLFIPQKS